MYSNYNTLELETVDNNILKVKLNLPESLNAVNSEMHYELSKVFNEIALDSTVRVVILTGSGKAFCAGGDIRWIQEMSDLKEKFKDVIYEGVNILQSMMRLPQPIISMVNGPAIGLGCTIALYSDIIIASENAKFADPHVKVGIVAGDGGALIWPLLVGPAKAKEYLMTGKVLPAREAERIGLINAVVPDTELEAYTMQLANELSNGPLSAIQLTKRAVNMFIETFTPLLTSALALEGLSFQSNDVKEATAAFLEKRQPNFKQKGEK